ncbi:hypothetical protein [Nocardia vermiculata]|uniref:Uncharacterized protein n=1 Tax=Nocardia vermiculata TaxID=257274 RepID=A0A846Y6Y0_9NOCA|nr:hypothetical protein [Nocardia vermiculata]NKY53461.1 hypothetical protein [Nocardia vermiculata]
MPDFAVAAMVIIGFACCALALRLAAGRSRPPRTSPRMSHRGQRARRAMMDR